MKTHSSMNRRRFIASLASIATAPMVVKAAALGRDGHSAPSNRIALGSIGVGWMGTDNLRAFLQKPEVQVLAVCDVDSAHRTRATGIVNEHYGTGDCAGYHDFRELIARGDLDAVCVSTPDHWHAIAAVAALRAGLDVYGEKPLTHSLREGRAICDAVRRYGRIWQTGSVLRSRHHFHRACELVRNGRIGKVQHVQVVIPGDHIDLAKNREQTQMGPPPSQLDYEWWLGPAPWEPYCPARVHMNWRWHMDYGGGMLMDFIGHHGDIALWGLGRENTGPVTIEASGNAPTGLWNAPTRFQSLCTYADGLTLRIMSEGRAGTTWFGENGRVFVTHEAFETDPPSLANETIGPSEVRLIRSTDHYHNFLDAIKARRGAVAPAESAHRAASLGHLTHIAIKVGRKLHWNPETEEFVNDPEAMRFLGRPYHRGWSL